MAECASCSAPLLPGANFCPNCGAKVASEGGPAAREVRKTVTILFSDLASSTALGERLDPEQLRALMGRYFGVMAAVIERHGGTVEKFIGDAIMAVFGIPAVHEDDALRAVRSAVEMRDELTALNTELRPRGLEIRTRTGINTGEVVTGDPASGRTLVTGDAVNTAARLEQSAEPGEILIGESTRRLVRDAISDEAVPALSVKGKAQPMKAYRLLAVAPEAAAGLARRLNAPFVGRDREHALLRQTWERVVAERSPQLFTVLGTAGVGKSRLSAEFLGAIGGVTVLRGRCLPYGEGITYWSLAEVLRSAAGVVETDDADAARARLDELVRPERSGEKISPLLHEAVGLASAGATQDELFWAVRRTLELLARREPLVVVWDDLHWAQQTFLDLVEHLAEWCRDVPLLFLGMARPELLDLRPGWGGGKLNATTILLEPLGAAASTELLLEIPGGAALPDDLRRRIAETAEGNPLFLEEIVRMLVDDGRLERTSDGWRADPEIATFPVPGSISALLSARLDRLGLGERQVAERASVVGRIFERGAVVELTPPDERPDVTQRLLALVRKELVRPESEPGLAGDDAYRFRHLLIRDAVYEALPKADRATLHVAFATWLERVTGDRIGEYEEVVAHHLERAYHYHAELGEDVEEIGRRAASRLVAAARRAQMRGDLPAGSALRRKALALPMAAGQRVDLLVQQARSHGDVGQFDDAASLLDEAELLVAGLDDEPLRMRVLVGRGFNHVARGEFGAVDHIAEDARRAAGLLEEVGDAVGVARATELAALAAYFAGDVMAARAGWHAAADWARRSGDHGEAARILPALPATAMYGWTTSTEAIAYCRQLAEEYPDAPMLHPRLLAIMALQHAWRGEIDVALDLRERSRALLDELGLPWLTGEIHWDYADIDLARGAWAEAEREARIAHEMTSRVGWPNAWETGLTVLYALHAQQRDREARAWLKMIREMPGTDTPSGRAYLPLWSALFEAVEGNAAAARAALDAAAPLDRDPVEEAWLLELRAETLALLGDREEALEAYRTAESTWERKEYFQLAGEVRRRIEQLESSGG